MWTSGKLTLVLGLDPGTRVTGWGLLEGDARNVTGVGFGRLLPIRGLSRAKIPPALKRKLVRNLNDLGALKQRETRALEELRHLLGRRVRILSAPDLGHEPRSLADLAQIAHQLQMLSA